MVYKRFEYYTREGIKWTEFFRWTSDIRDPWQLKGKLRNEYKDF